MFDFLWIALAIGVLASIDLAAANTIAKVRISKKLMETATPYEFATTDYAKTLLVLGDSLGVGVGADRPEDTIAGRLAAYLEATYVENHSVSGAEVADLSTQLQKVRLTHYDFVLIQIGGNDILAFHDAKRIGRELGLMINKLPDASRIIVMSEGDVAGATLFPWVLRFFYYFGSRAYHKEFAKVCPMHGATYLNLYQPVRKDPFFKHPKKYLAADGLHLSSAGYALWFEKLKEVI
jgi:lysophospholipase L1-like esterase